MLELNRGFILPALDITVQGSTIRFKRLGFHLQWVLNSKGTRASNDWQSSRAGYSRWGKRHWVRIWQGSRFCFGLIPQEAESMESGFQNVLLRQDWRSYQHSQRIQKQFLLIYMQGNTVCWTKSFWQIFTGSFFTVSNTWKVSTCAVDPLSQLSFSV